jgi:hypothetical protein
VRSLTLFLVILALSACSGSKKPKASNSSAQAEAGPSGTQTDADLLGREIFDLVDRAMSYKSAHRGRLPKSLKELGIDALTPTTSRSLMVNGAVPDVTVQFRTTRNHSLTGCHGTSSILEEASLGGGEFSVICSLPDGGSTTLRTSR